MGKRDAKPDPTPVFHTIEEANQALGRLGDVEKDLAGIVTGYSAARKHLDEKQARETAELVTEQKRLARDLEEFSREHLEEGGFKGAKSLELPAGFLGFRKSTKLEWLLKKTDDVVKAIENLPRNTRLGKLIASKVEDLIKTKKTPVKTAIRALDLLAEDLAQIGCRLAVDEFVFAYSTDKSKTFDLSDEEE